MRTVLGLFLAATVLWSFSGCATPAAPRLATGVAYDDIDSAPPGFEETGVMRSLRASGLPLPVRPLLGPAPHEVVWREADSARVRDILHNQAYAGAYVYGRRQQDPTRRRPASVRGTAKVAIADWTVCLKAAHPGYIGWEEFMANQRRLTGNATRYEAGHAGVPRKGSALLQGIAICGRCGRRMSLRYTGPKGDYPVYCCRSDRDQQGSALCQEVRALPVDTLVERVLLDALAPDRIAIALAAVGQLEEESRQLERQWTLRQERARYDAERARRQYDAVEPENRLVARSLERAWEEKLRAVVGFVQGLQYQTTPFRLSAFVPTEGKQVLRDQYADCKDKAAFLVAMLRATARCGEAYEKSGGRVKSTAMRTQ